MLYARREDIWYVPLLASHDLLRFDAVRDASYQDAMQSLISKLDSLYL